MARSFMSRRSSIMPLFFCFLTCTLIAGYGIVQSAIGSAGTNSLHMADGNKNLTPCGGQTKLAGNQTTTPSDPQAKQPPVRLKVTPPSNKHTFPPTIQVSPEDAEKLKKLFDQMISGQKAGPAH